jgi:hypothetical protein
LIAVGIINVLSSAMKCIVVNTTSYICAASWGSPPSTYHRCSLLNQLIL